MMVLGRLLLAGAVALAFSPLPARAQAPAQAAPDMAALVKVINDRAQPIEKREDALGKATLIALRQPQPRGGPLKEALGPLLDESVRRKNEAPLARFTILLLRALDAYKPYDGLQPRLRALLAKDSIPALREAALRTIQVHGVGGLAAELEAFMREGGDEPTREATERTIMEAAEALEPAECTRIVSVTLEVSKFRGVRIMAARALGEKRSEAGKRILLTAAAPTEKDELVACEAALALGRNGSMEGVGALLERVKVRQGSLAVYRALCAAALREHEGFGGVSPAAYYEVGKEGRAKAIAAAVEWYEGTKARAREDVLFDSLKARGINVPADRRGKEAITALIDALTVDPASLRYAALDLLVERTGKTDLAEGFRTVQRSLRGNTAYREHEPPEGFQDEMRKELLKTQQGEKQARWRQWWDSVKGRAESVGGKWVVKG